ncbi:MAG TPA: hypothetical protein VMI52_13925 [Acetobacteraceae bacterium]|nr:hypothetical protein [Acetobacteraceae bacterium]
MQRRKQKDSSGRGIDEAEARAIETAVPPGDENPNSIVHIKGSGAKEELAEIHDAAMAHLPNVSNASQPGASSRPRSSSDRRLGAARHPLDCGGLAPSTMSPLQRKHP